MFPERPDFGIVLFFDLIFLAERFQLPVVAILPQGWLHLFEDLVKQLDLLVLLPANRNLFFLIFFKFHIVKVQSLTKCLNLCALGSQPDAVQVVLSIFLKLRLNVVDLSVQALGKSVLFV